MFQAKINNKVQEHIYLGQKLKNLKNMVQCLNLIHIQDKFYQL